MSRLYDLCAYVVRGLYDLRIHAPALLDLEDDFPEWRRFAEQWPTLRAEASGVMFRLQRIPRFHELLESQTSISANDGRDWRMFVVKAYGVPIAPNLAACPMLAALLERTPQVLSACLSFVAPGKRIPIHRGPLRGVLRFHLGLIVPKDADGRPGTVLWVDGMPHRIGEGDTLLWDDTYPHELHNASDGVRVALLLDVWRPRMPADMQWLTRAITLTARAAARFRHREFAAS
jgi:aspartate beta-hydroxylase